MNWDVNAEENKKMLEELKLAIGHVVSNTGIAYERLVEIFVKHAGDIDYQVRALSKEGLTNANIGDLLGLSESQVRCRMFYDPKELGPFKNFDSALDIWQAIRKEKHTITCSQKYGNLSKITKWLMERDISFYVDDYQAQLDDEAGYKIHLIISEVELAGLDEYMGTGSFVYVE